MPTREQIEQGPQHVERSEVLHFYDWHIFTQYLLAQALAQASVMTECLAQQSHLCRNLYAAKERSVTKTFQIREQYNRLRAEYDALASSSSTIMDAPAGSATTPPGTRSIEVQTSEETAQTALEPPTSSTAIPGSAGETTTSNNQQA